MVRRTENKLSNISNRRADLTQNQSRLRRYAGKALRTLLVLIFWLAVWLLIYRLVNRDLVFASPGQVIRRLAELAATREFWRATLDSLARIGLGFVIGLAAGIVLAIATAASKWFNTLFKPLLGMIRATPVSSFIILALIWMSNVRVVVFIVFLMVMPIIWANLHEGINKTDRQLLEMGKLFRFGRYKMIRWIYLPSLSPFLVSAVTTGLGLGWKAGIAAEVLSTPSSSLGKALYDSKIYLETADLFAYTAVVIIVSMVLEKIIIKGLASLQTLAGRHEKLFDWNAKHLLSKRSMYRGKNGDE